MGSSFWDKAYQSEGALWGDRPGILTQAARGFVLAENLPTAGKQIVDIGCGYGRDLGSLAAEWGCRALGVDSSPKAISMAQELLTRTGVTDVTFRQASFQSLQGETFDLVFAANLYQILPRAERAEFCAILPAILPPGGYLFLGTHSVHDPEHSGKGRMVDGEENSFVDKTLVHLSTEAELRTNFRFLNIHQLYEHEYLEPRAGGEIHHHISWILIGSKPQIT